MGTVPEGHMEMSSPPLSLAVSSATEATSRALGALVALAESLGTPEAVAPALERARAALEGAEAARAALQEALVAAVAAVGTAGTSGTPGLDPEGLYRALGAAAEAAAAQLERELRRNRRRRRVFWAGRTLALGLMVVCAPLLSLDAVRESLGVTQECHLVPCLATLTLLCQGLLWALGTSRRHLATAAGHQRHRALRYRRLARASAAAAAATAEATAAATGASAALGTLEEVAGHLGDLVAAVDEDLELGPGFPASSALLGDIAVALGTALGDGEGTRSLERAARALPGDE